MSPECKQFIETFHALKPFTEADLLQLQKFTDLLTNEELFCIYASLNRQGPAHLDLCSSARRITFVPFVKQHLPTKENLLHSLEPLYLEVNTYLNSLKDTHDHDHPKATT